MLIVDNCTVNYMLQLSNGIPIKDYNGDKNDCLLYNLTKYLMAFKSVPDVRAKITGDFKLNELLSGSSNMRDE